MLIGNSWLGLVLCLLPVNFQDNAYQLLVKMRETGQRQRRKKRTKVWRGGKEKNKTKFTFINHSRTHFKRSEMNEKKKRKKRKQNKDEKGKKKILLHTFRPQAAPSVCGCGCASVGFVFNALLRAAINVNLTPASHFTSCQLRVREMQKCF